MPDSLTQSGPANDTGAAQKFVQKWSGVELSEVKWRALKGEVPHADLDARLTLAAFGTTAFILPQLLLIAVVALLSRAHANWAAPI